MLFNLVMIGVAERPSEIKDVRHSIYADDITLWVEGGSDGNVESALQEAVDAIESYLQDTGLRCSPKKSELLLYHPVRNRKNKIQREHEKIKVWTKDGTIIHTVPKIRVLGMTIESLGRNGDTVTRLTHKVANATRLLRRVSTRRGGMKEENLTRLIHSFVICHIAYVAAFHNWRRSEKSKINVLIRRAYKTALRETTNTNQLL